MSKELKTQPRPDFYTAGGTLKATAPSYIERAADKQLLEAIRKRHFCYVLTPRQLGKSSLMVRTAFQLKKDGMQSAIIDLTGIGTDLNLEAWYSGQLQRIAKQLPLRTNYLDWWQQQRHLGAVQRFSSFLTDVVLKEVVEPVVVFVDEIDTTLSLPKYSDDYFAAIRALYNDRTINPELERLTFVLLGVVSPSDLIKDPQRTPFNIGRRIPLTDFTLEEAQALAAGLAPVADLALALLERVLFWTGGHPYLTQKTCSRVAQWAQVEWNPSDVPLVVDDLVHNMFLSEAGRNTDDNLRFIRDQVLETTDSAQLFESYRYIRRREVVDDTELDPLLVKLKLSGLIKATDVGVLNVRNPIYERVFDESWIRTELSERKAQPAVQEFTYDAFVSYSHLDADWVKGYLLPRLEGAGLKVVIDYRDFEPGAPLVTEIEQAVTSSRYTIIVVTPAWVATEWSELESLLVQSFFDPAAINRRLIPLLLTPSKLPPRIGMLAVADFTRQDRWEREIERLLSALDAPQQMPPVKISVPPIPETFGKYNTGAIRQLLKETFDDEGIMALTFDHFRPVYEQFSTDMSKNWKIQLLIEHAEKQDLLDFLLDRVAELNPRQYRRFSDQLEAKGKTYNLFMGHTWTYSADYHRLVDLINAVPNFKWRNYSVPRHDPAVDPNTDAGRRTLIREMDQQIRPVSCVIIIAGMYAAHRYWIQKEIEIAQGYGKPIVGVVPRGQERTPKVVQDAAVEMVRWTTASIVGAIRRHSL